MSNERRRDFRATLASERCWDTATQRIFEARGEPVDDCILQNREELIRLCEFIETHQVRSYLEIGVWTGRLITALRRIFDFELVAACDHGWAERFGLEIQLPPGARFLRADSDSDAFSTWRAALGHVDLVLIDADHSFHAVARDFEINSSFSCRFIAFHDILGANRYTVGVRKFWQALSGKKRELVEPHRELGLDHSTMGIGIWVCEVNENTLSRS